MGENLIIDENNPDLLNMFLGDELYLVSESQWFNEIPSEGGNKYRFLNVFSHPGKEIIPAGDRDSFFRVINAIKTDKFDMDADGLAAVNINGMNGLQWNNLKEKFSPHYCIFWNVDPNTIGLPCKYMGGAIDGDCRILYLPDLGTIEKETEIKRKAWSFIQRLFKQNTKA